MCQDIKHCHKAVQLALAEKTLFKELDIQLQIKLSSINQVLPKLTWAPVSRYKQVKKKLHQIWRRFLHIFGHSGTLCKEYRWIFINKLCKFTHLYNFAIFPKVSIFRLLIAFKCCKIGKKRAISLSSSAGRLTWGGTTLSQQSCEIV